LKFKNASPTAPLLIAAALAALFAACARGSTEVKVGLKEWSVTPEVAQVKSGEVRFVVTNEGREPHEFVIIRSDLNPNALPVIDGKVDEERVEVIDEIESFPAGATERKGVRLKAGKYLLICNIVERTPGQPIESHYEQGMTTAFLVTQ
jgi:uncharacterized cupredoxin-like copper-binding protein